jgi:acetyl-CoA C-acetyltransferase
MKVPNLLIIIGNVDLRGVECKKEVKKMARKGIKDKVAIIGCDMTKYGELWDKSQYDLLFEAVQSATKDAGITKNEIDASWIGIFYFFTGLSGAMVEDILKLDGKPATRVENYCASGMDAFRKSESESLLSGMQVLL